jgi:hypothetical protein
MWEYTWKAHLITSYTGFQDEFTCNSLMMILYTHIIDTDYILLLPNQYEWL